MTTVRAWFFPLLAHLVNGLKVMLVLVGGFMVVGGEITIGDFTAFAVYLSMLVGPLMGATFLMFLLQRGMTSLGSLLEVLTAAPQRPAPRAEASLPARLVEGLTVEGLRFAYPDEAGRPVLDGVSLRVAPGGGGGRVRPRRQRQDHARQSAEPPSDAAARRGAARRGGCPGRRAERAATARG